MTLLELLIDLPSYLYSSSGSSWPVQGWTIPLPLQ